MEKEEKITCSLEELQIWTSPGVLYLILGCLSMLRFKQNRQIQSHVPLIYCHKE